MRAMQFTGESRTLVSTEQPVPRPQADQVLIRVRACAVCRTDLHIVDGELPRPKRPVVPGHEIVGAVVERGSRATWSGDSTSPPPRRLDAALVFAPVGSLVPAVLAELERGGRVVCAGIHMSDVPTFPYSILWHERSIRSVANLTRRDAEEFLDLAPRVPVRTRTMTYPLEQANRALDELRSGRIEGAAVLAPRPDNARGERVRAGARSAVRPPAP